MKKSIAKKWTAALRSGKYKQGRNALKFEGKYCCLGVLCAISPWKYNYTTMPDRFGTKNRVLPEKVLEWAGIKKNTGRYKDDTSLVIDNDGGVSFKRIAFLIEKYREEL